MMMSNDVTILLKRRDGTSSHWF